MTKIKSAHRFMDRQGAAILALAIGSMAVVGVVLSYVSDVTWQKVVGVTWFICVGAGLIGILSRMGRAFKCPDCGGPVGPLLETDRRPGTPLLRLCSKCDVLWQVGSDPDS